MWYLLVCIRTLPQVVVKEVKLVYTGRRDQPQLRIVDGLRQAFYKCTSVSMLVGYSAIVIEMLLMMSGDVERNPGPGE